MSALKAYQWEWCVIANSSQLALETCMSILLHGLFDAELAIPIVQIDINAQDIDITSNTRAIPQIMHFLFSYYTIILNDNGSE